MTAGSTDTGPTGQRAGSQARGRVGRRAGPPPVRQGDERGQTAVLIIGFVLVLVMAVAVVVDATAAYLRRQALDTLADGAALAAADGIEGQSVYTGGLDDRAEVDPATAAELVDAYLASVGAARRYPGLARSVETEGARVVVHLTTPLELPLRLPRTGEATHVSAVAAAVVTVGD